MKTDRKAILDAAAVLIPMWSAGGYWSDTSISAQYEKVLTDSVVEAQKKLDDFRRSRAARLAVESLLPGFVDIDASEHLPREKWHIFVSNDAGEWITWLMENGVNHMVAESLVNEAFDRQRQEP